MHLLCLPENELIAQFFYGMAVIGSLSMVGDGGGCGGGALGGFWEGVGRALAGGEGWVWESDLWANQMATL